jgi:Flp pilus assembly pilin Flp
MRDNKGQNMVEYVLLVGAVLLVCIFFYSSSTGPMPTIINATLNSMVNQVDNLNSQIQFP